MSCPVSEPHRGAHVFVTMTWFESSFFDIQNHSLATKHQLNSNYLHRFLHQYVLDSMVIYLCEV